MAISKIGTNSLDQSGNLELGATGNVGIGTSSPTTKLDVRGTGYFINNTNDYVKILTDNGSMEISRSAGDAYIDLKNIDSEDFDCRIQSAGTSGDLRLMALQTQQFQTGGSERMRIDSSGKVSIGSATTTYAQLNSTTTSDFQASLNATNASGYSSLYFTLNDAQKGAIYQEHGTTRLYVRCNGSGGVYLASGATSWTANSDERLKTDLKPIEDASNKVSTLRAVTGRYLTDEEGTSRSFLIAQDVQKVLPEAVDATDPDKLGVQYADTIPLLVAAIKEQQELIKQLQADVAALKGKA